MGNWWETDPLREGDEAIARVSTFDPLVGTYHIALVRIVWFRYPDDHPGTGCWLVKGSPGVVAAPRDILDAMWIEPGDKDEL